MLAIERSQFSGIIRRKAAGSSILVISHSILHFIDMYWPEPLGFLLRRRERRAPQQGPQLLFPYERISLRRMTPARPIKPDPIMSRLEGSGTGLPDNEKAALNGP